MDEFVEHPLIKPNKMKSRVYQEKISATAVKKNTLVVLPTGLGKTYVGIMVAAHRLHEYPESKVLIIAPTRPLCAQHQKVFQEYMNLDPKNIVLITGKIKQVDRKELYKIGKVIVSTPQCIQNDVEAGILTLAPYSLLIVDETHRSVKKYSYTFVVNYYFEQASHPLVLGLTASPGGIKDKIEEVKKNLRIEAVEIRTEKDADVIPYVQKTKIERIYVELPDEFKKIRTLLQEAYEDRLRELAKHKLIPSMKVSKKDLLNVQAELGKMYERTKNFVVVKALVTCAQAIKIEHAIELLETQGITSLIQYFLKLSREKKSSASRKMLKDPRIIEVMKETKELYVKGIDHPKLEKLIGIVKTEVKKNPRVKIIVFANYRSTVEKIVKLLELNAIEAREFIGQAKKMGKSLSQKEQIEILNEFKYEMFNVLVSTSLGEEGIDISEVSLVIFYEPVPSELRQVQRRGRTGRTKPGRVIFLITKDTRDEWYYWSAYHKEKRMKRILYEMKAGKTERDESLRRWIS